MLSILSLKKVIISFTSFLSSANAFNLVEFLFCKELTLSQTSPGFDASAVQAFWKHCGKGEINRHKQFLLFPVFSTLFENFLPFSSNLKLSSAKSFYPFGELSANFRSLKLSSAKAFVMGVSKICLLGKG